MVASGLDRVICAYGEHVVGDKEGGGVVLLPDQLQHLLEDHIDRVDIKKEIAFAVLQAIFPQGF